MNQKKYAVVTGANKGLGLGVSLELAQKGFHVFMLGRNEVEIHAAAEGLKKQNFSVEPMVVDVEKDESVRGLGQKLLSKTNVIDVLVNNAGVYLEKTGESRLEKISLEIVSKTMNINTFGALRVAQEIFPLLKNSSAPRIVNVSSGMGQLQEISGGSIAYRMSKTAMNMLTKVMHTDWSKQLPNLKVNSVCPGWVRTSMGGEEATRSLDEGVASIIWAALLENSGPSGGYFRDGKPLAW